MEKDSAVSKYDHLKDLVLKMIAADTGRVEKPIATGAGAANLIRRPKVISDRHTSALSKTVKLEQWDRVQKQSAPVDDPVGMPLLLKYKGIFFFENDVAKSQQKSYQILDVNYVSNRSQWVTASVPVELLPDGQWAIPASLLVKGGSAAVPMSDAYVFHMLADVTNPDNIVYTDYMDGYVEAHNSRKQAAPLKRKRKL